MIQSAVNSAIGTVGNVVSGIKSPETAGVNEMDQIKLNSAKVKLANQKISLLQRQQQAREKVQGIIDAKTQQRQNNKMNKQIKEIMKDVKGVI